MAGMALQHCRRDIRARRPVAAHYRGARRAGFTVPSSVDCLIAACALQNGVTVVHCDRDYSALARIAPLTERSIRPLLGARRR